MVMVGIPEKQTPIRAIPLIGARLSLADSSIGGIKETQEMLEFCNKNSVVGDIKFVSLKKVNETYECVMNSDVRSGFVIDMESLECKDNVNFF
jgi:uncharacterized zinc-type alcohol dehydrogenase-like protein